MFYTSADFVTFTRKQANVVYAAYKRGDIKMTRKQVAHLYDCVGTDDFTFYGVVQFLFEGRYDLAQADLDGRKIETYEVKHVTRIPITEDNVDEYLFLEVGEVYEEVTTEICYRIAD